MTRTYRPAEPVTFSFQAEHDVPDVMGSGITLTFPPMVRVSGLTGADEDGPHGPFLVPVSSGDFTYALALAVVEYVADVRGYDLGDCIGDVAHALAYDGWGMALASDETPDAPLVLGPWPYTV